MLCLLSLPYLLFAQEMGKHQNGLDRPTHNLSGFAFGETLSIVLTDPLQKDSLSIEEKHPWIRLFENGKDVTNRDLQSTLDVLKLARSLGRTKIQPEEDKAPGLIITFRGIELTPNSDPKGYTLKLVGEFNSTEFQIDNSQMKSLFEGKLTTWDLSSETNRSTGATRYIVKTQLKLRLTLENQVLKIHSLEGGGRITTVGFSSRETFISPAINLGNPSGFGTLYEGKVGTLPKLPIIK